MEVFIHFWIGNIATSIIIYGLTHTSKSILASSPGLLMIGGQGGPGDEARSILVHCITIILL
jgi:hypothetical protein